MELSLIKSCSWTASSPSRWPRTYRALPVHVRLLNVEAQDLHAQRLLARQRQLHLGLAVDARERRVRHHVFRRRQLHIESKMILLNRGGFEAEGGVCALWLGCGATYNWVKRNANILKCVTSVVLEAVSNAAEMLAERDVWSTFAGECGGLVPY